MSMLEGKKDINKNAVD